MCGVARPGSHGPGTRLDSSHLPSGAGWVLKGSADADTGRWDKGCGVGTSPDASALLSGIPGKPRASPFWSSLPIILPFHSSGSLPLQFPSPGMLSLLKSNMSSKVSVPQLSLPSSGLLCHGTVCVTWLGIRVVCGWNPSLRCWGGPAPSLFCTGRGQEGTADDRECTVLARAGHLRFPVACSFSTILMTWYKMIPFCR